MTGELLTAAVLFMVVPEGRKAEKKEHGYFILLQNLYILACTNHNYKFKAGSI
jgi:hypothetical protein